MKRTKHSFLLSIIVSMFVFFCVMSIVKLQIEIILESYRKDLANVMDDDELCLIIQSKMMALNQVLNEINDM